LRAGCGECVSLLASVLHQACMHASLLVSQLASVLYQACIACMNGRMNGMRLQAG